MTTTRAQVLDHLIGTVLDQDESSALAVSLKEENLTSLADVMSLSENDIEMLMYTGKGKDGKALKPKEVPRWAKRRLRILQSYIHYQRSEGTTDFVSLTQTDYDDYRSFVYNPNAPHPPPSNSSSYSAPCIFDNDFYIEKDVASDDDCIDTIILSYDGTKENPPVSRMWIAKTI